MLSCFSQCCRDSALRCPTISDAGQDRLGGQEILQGQQMDISGLFRSPQKDLMISFGITLAASFAGGYFGNLYGAGAGDAGRLNGYGHGYGHQLHISP